MQRGARPRLAARKVPCLSERSVPISPEFAVALPNEQSTVCLMIGSNLSRVAVTIHSLWKSDDAADSSALPPLMWQLL